MKKYLKRLSIMMLILFAAIMLNTGKAEAATVKAADTPGTTNPGKITPIGDSYILKIDISDLSGKECIVKIPLHIVTTIKGKKYKIIAGQYYCKNGVLEAISSDKHLALPYYELKNNLNEFSNKGSKIVARTSYSKISGTKGAVITGISGDEYGDLGFWYGENAQDAKNSKGEFYHGYPNFCKTYNEDTANNVIVVLPNSGNSFQGVDDNGLICKSGALYSGYTLKDGKMYKVSSGKPATNGYTGSVSNYFDFSDGKFKSQSAKTYKDGVLVSGWVTSGSLTYGVYKDGILDKSKNNWNKNSNNNKWYFLQGGKIYRTGKKGPAGKKLSTAGLNYWGHGKASPGNYRYYLNADGSLVTNVFAADSSWYKKKMRIYINVKAGIDNVTFMGYIKGSGYCVPLKTIVTTCSKKNRVLKKQIRGRGGKGKWKLGRTGKSRHRWFLFHKNGHTYYYQYATSIIGSGALFHSPRFLRKNIRSLYKPHFNAMGKKNITTKCVRIQVANALMVYNISKKCKSYNYVSFVRRARTKKTAYLPFGITELSDAIGKSSWDQNYDPSDPAIK